MEGGCERSYEEDEKWEGKAVGLDYILVKVWMWTVLGETAVEFLTRKNLGTRKDTVPEQWRNCVETTVVLSR